MLPALINLKLSDLQTSAPAVKRPIEADRTSPGSRQQKTQGNPQSPSGQQVLENQAGTSKNENSPVSYEKDYSSGDSFDEYNYNLAVDTEQNQKNEEEHLPPLEVMTEAYGEEEPDQQEEQKQEDRAAEATRLQVFLITLASLKDLLLESTRDYTYNDNYTTLLHKTLGALPILQSNQQGLTHREMPPEAHVMGAQPLDEYPSEEEEEEAHQSDLQDENMSNILREGVNERDHDKIQYEDNKNTERVTSIIICANVLWKQIEQIKNMYYIDNDTLTELNSIKNIIVYLQLAFQAKLSDPVNVNEAVQFIANYSKLLSVSYTHLTLPTN